MPEQPISAGSISQGMPERRTKMMPASASSSLATAPDTERDAAREEDVPGTVGGHGSRQGGDAHDDQGPGGGLRRALSQCEEHRDGAPLDRSVDRPVKIVAVGPTGIPLAASDRVTVEMRGRQLRDAGGQITVTVTSEAADACKRRASSLPGPNAATPRSSALRASSVRPSTT